MFYGCDKECGPENPSRDGRRSVTDTPRGTGKINHVYVDLSYVTFLCLKDDVTNSSSRLVLS